MTYQEIINLGLKKGISEIELYAKTSTDKTLKVFNGNLESYNAKEIYSLRGGSLPGLHKIIFLGEGEEIEITHRAYDKSIFAKGALFCASKLINKEKGFYSLNDLINE